MTAPATRVRLSARLPTLECRLVTHYRARSRDFRKLSTHLPYFVLDACEAARMQSGAGAARSSLSVRPFTRIGESRRQARFMKTIGALLVMTAWLAGSAARPDSAAAADGPVLPLPDEDQQRITTLLGPGVVGQALASSMITDASVYFPLQERVLTYQVTSGSQAGNMQTVRVAKGKRPGGTPAWRFALSPSLAGFINQSPAGDLTMPAISDSGEGVVVITTPANPFLLNGMQPGETRTFAQTVSVNYLDDPTRQDYSGTLESRYTYVGTYQVTVPAGTYAAILLRLKYEGKVGPAKTTDTAYYFFAPQVGGVALISQEDVEAFWVIHIDTTIAKVLASVN